MGSATKIQALFRGYIVRKMFLDAEIENIEDTGWLKSIANSTVTDSIQILGEEDIMDSDSDAMTCQSSVSIFDYFSRPGTSSTQATGDTRYSAYQSSNYEQFIPGRKVKDRSYVEVSEMKPVKNHGVAGHETSENRQRKLSGTMDIEGRMDESNQNLSNQNVPNQNVPNQNVPNHKITEPLKTEKVREEWNISEKTAELMMQRAKRMNKKSKKSKPKKPSLPPINQALSSSSRYRLPNK